MIFKACLKEDVDAEWQTSYGNGFHCVGPVKEKARCPEVFVFVKGMRKVLVSEKTKTKNPQKNLSLGLSVDPTLFSC